MTRVKYIKLDSRQFETSIVDYLQSKMLIAQRSWIVRSVFNCNLLKSFDYFLIFAQNIDCGYTLEPMRRF